MIMKKRSCLLLILCCMLLTFTSGCGRVKKPVLKNPFSNFSLSKLSVSKWTDWLGEKTYSGAIGSKEAEKRTGDMMDQVLEALNAGDADGLVSLFSQSVKDADPELETMVKEVMQFYQGTGSIVDDSYYGERKHANRGTFAYFGQNLYTVETEVTSYRIGIGTFASNAFDRNMEGLFVFQIWEDGYATGKLVRQGIESDGGVFLYHCNTPEQLEELPHLLIAEDDMIETSDLSQKRRETMSIAMEDAGVEQYDPLTLRSYIDYYDQIPVSYNCEFESSDDIYYLYRFDLETMEIIDHISYPVSHPEYAM